MEKKKPTSKYPPVHTYNDQEMISQNLRVPYLQIDRTQFSKTDEERAKLITAKSKYRAALKSNPQGLEDSKNEFLSIIANAKNLRWGSANVKF